MILLTLADACKIVKYKFYLLCAMHLCLKIWACFFFTLEKKRDSQEKSKLSNQATEMSESVVTKVSKLGEMLKKKRSKARVEISEDLVDDESLALHQFRSMKCLLEQSSIPDFDDSPLLWWSQYSTLLPDLSELAKGYLAMQATSCASERLFSRAGFIMRNRSCLTTDNVNMLAFLAMNSKDDK